jgi:hypothetical protein
MDYGVAAGAADCRECVWGAKERNKACCRAGEPPVSQIFTLQTRVQINDFFPIHQSLLAGFISSIDFVSIQHMFGT